VGLGAPFLIEWLLFEIIEAALIQIGSWTVHQLIGDRGSPGRGLPSGARTATRGISGQAERLRAVHNVTLLSSTPGRTRLSVVGVRGDTCIANSVADTLRALPGVRSVTVSVLTGTALVLYEIGATNAEQLCEAAQAWSSTVTRSLTPRQQMAPKLAVVGA
jgi:copper chaperone CopZ